jgi:hypothetical protein
MAIHASTSRIRRTPFDEAAPDVYILRGVTVYGTLYRLPIQAQHVGRSPKTQPGDRTARSRRFCDNSPQNQNRLPEESHPVRHLGFESRGGDFPQNFTDRSTFSKFCLNFVDRNAENRPRAMRRLSNGSARVRQPRPLCLRSVPVPRQLVFGSSPIRDHGNTCRASRVNRCRALGRKTGTSRILGYGSPAMARQNSFVHPRRARRRRRRGEGLQFFPGSARISLCLSIPGNQRGFLEIFFLNS